MFTALVVALAGASFLLSASAGMGGSLLLVPALSMLLGTKQGIALAAAMLGVNNIWKTVAYRASIPWRAVVMVGCATGLGAWLGSAALLAAPEGLVAWAVVVALLASFLLERRGRPPVGPKLAPLPAFAAGATSGLSGTSGPLKGVALRAVTHSRQTLVGAAAVVSLAGDLVGSASFAGGGLLTPESIGPLLWALPIMPIATFAGRHLNTTLGERGYTTLFWTVMAGYTARLPST